MLGVPSFPAQASPQRQSNDKKTRNKISLKPGRSLMDWIRYANSGKDLQGFGGRITPVTNEELKIHNVEGDCWIALHGQVFNITPYLEYHPGGFDELMRGAGINATDLFDGVHKWVNYASMLAKCYIGPLKQDIISSSAARGKVSDSIPVKKNDDFLAPSGIAPSKPSEVMPRYDWYASGDQIIVSVYTKSKIVYFTDVILDCHDGKTLTVSVLFGTRYYLIHLDLHGSVKDAKIQSVTGTKIEISLLKEDVSKQWKSLGKGLTGHNAMHDEKERDLVFRDCVITSVEHVTHDTKLFTILLPSNVCYEAPIGHHVIIKDYVEGMEIRRNYTVALQTLRLSALNKKQICKELHLMIKMYADGALSSRLDKLNQGDVISVSDCTGDFQRSQLENVKKVFLIAAGTGFTPMIRLIDFYFSNEQYDDCLVNLLFANKQEEDVLWKSELDCLARDFCDRFKVVYILSQPSPTWNGLKGRIDKNVLQSFISNERPSTTIPKTSNTPVLGGIEVEIGSDLLYAICGPDQFTKSINSMLLELGVGKANIHCFLG